MYRTDIRRHARVDRRNDAQSPYKHRPAPKAKSSEGGFWSFMKSWSIFGKSEEPNSDSNIQQSLPEDEASTGPGTTNQEWTYNNRANSMPPIPGAFEESIVPSMTLKPDERPVGQNAPRAGRPLSAATVSAGPYRPQAPPLEAAREPSNHERNVPVTGKELQKADSSTISNPSYGGRKSNSGVSGTAIVRHNAAEATTSSTAEQEEGAISSANSQKSSKSLVKRSPAPATMGSSKAETSESEDQQSPAIPNNGLPPFRSGGLEPNGSVPTLDDPNMEYGDIGTQHMVSQWDHNTLVLRQALNINFEDIYEPGAWEELARYKGLKSPASPVDQKAEEKVVKEIDWQPPHLKDENAGYTPTELMVNPYERISAFRGRNRKPVGFPSKKMRRNPSSLPQGPSVERKNDSNKRPMLPPPAPKTRRMMGNIQGYMRKYTSHHELPYEAEPEAPQMPEDYALPGVAPNGSRYLTVLRRSSGATYVTVDGDVLDGPIEPALKRRKFDDPEHLDTTNFNRPILIDDMVEVPIEVPASPPVPKIPSVLLSRHKLDKQKKERPRKKLPIIPPEAMRPRHSLHSPVKPSPLRNVSKFVRDSPEMRPEELGTGVKPQERVKSMIDNIPSYDFVAGTSLAGKMDSLLSSPTMVKAKQQATSLKPYEVPSYSFRQTLRQTRLAAESKGVARTVPKTAPSKGKTVTNGARQTSYPNFQLASTPSKSSSSVPRQSSPLKTVLATADPITPPKPVNPAPAAVSGGFNWAAAGMKVPVQAAGSWTCSICSILNKPEAKKCAACETVPTPAAASASASGGFNWAAAGLKVPVQAAGSWTCDLCSILNKPEAKKCMACESARA